MKERVAVVPDVKSMAEKKAAKLEKLAVRWGGHTSLFLDGFTPIPRTFLRVAAVMKPYSLSPTQMLFVEELMYHKWDERKPFPSYKTLAQRMGISVTYARSTARALEKKGYLVRIVRTGRPNEFDLQPLFDAMAKHVEAEAKATAAPKKKAA